MEDEGRPLPPHWVRQYDPIEHHQFFVDTSADPPRSIWQHPYDDDTYLASVSPAERERIKGLHKVPSRADMEAESSADEDHHDYGQGVGHEPELKGVHKLGRKMKDKITGSTHTERESQRRARAEEEQRLYEQHRRYRLAMSKAMQTGEPQLLGKDRDGRDVYIEPPQGMGGYSGGRQYPGNGYGYDPYGSGVYGNPNARYLRPSMPYQRPMGYGYGGGYGMGMGGPMMGLGGGLLLGSLLF